MDGYNNNNNNNNQPFDNNQGQPYNQGEPYNQPYNQGQPYNQPYNQGQPYNINVVVGDKKEPTSTAVGKVALVFSIIGAVTASCCCTTYFSFVFFLVAIVCGIVAIIKNKHDGCALAALIISGVFTLAAIGILISGVGQSIMDSVQNSTGIGSATQPTSQVLP